MPTKRPALYLGTHGLPLLRRRFALAPPLVPAHKHVIGTTGVGKSKFLTSMFVQLVEQGIGVALIDPHADLAHDVLRVLAERRFFRHPDAQNRLVFVDFSRRGTYVPFNVLRQPYDDHTVARNVVEACKRAWPALADGSAPQFENILLASTLVLIQNRLALTQLPRLLTDDAYRATLLNHVSDPEVVHFFRARFDRWGRDAAVMMESTLRRVFLLTFSPPLRHALGATENALDLRRCMDRGTSLIFNLGGLDEDSQRLLGCLLTVGFEVAALSRAEVPEAERRPYHLLIDEFSQFSAQSEGSLARVLSLARKYGLSLTLAHQTWSQVSARLEGALQNAVEIAFRLGRSDAEWAAPRFGRYDPYTVKHEVADVVQLGRTHPVYFSLQEAFEGWTQSLTDLRPREAFVNTGERTVKIRTLNVPESKRTHDEMRELAERYAMRIQKPVAAFAGSSIRPRQTPSGAKRVVRVDER
ncbi:MAG: type IV secretion system DNA-binding domain-containing protein [Dehalococcoidia bacterium]